MIRCNMCEKTFKTELDIPFIVRLENGETEFLRVGIPIKPGSEVFRGCPHCMTDAYLMDMDEHGLTEEEVEEAFNNYPLDYQDRSIIGTVFEDSEELGREEAYSLGYVKEGELTERYFDFEKFGEDLIEEEMYQELESGKCVMYMM